jgi:hypothetical protein
MVEVRISDEVTDVLAALATLVEHRDELPHGPEFWHSLERMLRDGSYRFITGNDGPGGPVVVAGILTFFWQPMRDDHLLAIESLWVREDNLPALLPVVRTLIELSQRLDFAGVCLTETSTNAVRAVRELRGRQELDGYPVSLGRPPLQKRGNPSPIWSAFSDEAITDRAFISVPAVLVATRKVKVDISGQEYSGAGPLYRGEGRKVSRYWNCVDLNALAEVHFAEGFRAGSRRFPEGSTAPFHGTIAEQLLHQGYVGQGAISLTTSFEVARAYALSTGVSNYAEGLVFTIDAERLRQQTTIFDATATLAAACPWIPYETWTPLRHLVLALRTDLHAAGHILEECYLETMQRARAGIGSLAPRPDLLGDVAPEVRAALEIAGVRRDELERMYDAFLEFAEFATQRVGTVDELHPTDDHQDGYTVTTHRVGPLAYFEMFRQVQQPLDARMKRAEREGDMHAHPGWDTTAFGYIAKTARDEECFVAGAIPGECILEAQVVTRSGHLGPCIRPS